MIKVYITYVNSIPSLDSCLVRVIDFFDDYNFVKLTSIYQKIKLLFQCQKNGTKVTHMKT